MLLADLAIVVLFLFGVALFRSPKRALYGTWVAGFALILAALSVSVRHDLFDVEWVLIGIVLGSTTGWWWAARSDSIKVPALVAFQNGAGGLASFLISMVELVRRPDSGMGVAEISGIIGLVLGAATFSASLLASARLAGSIGQKPVVWRGHHLYLIITSLAILGFVIPGVWETGGMRVACFGAAVGLSILLGLQFAVRVGGADMPVLISFLNANSGFAAAFCGLIVDHQLLVATGATVAASGSILTLAMCRAMNRSLRHVLWGGSVGSPMAGVESQVVPTPLGNPGNAEATEAAPALQQTSEADSWEMAKRACKEATSVIIVPGYGIALAEAHHELASLARLLEDEGKRVRFAVHPVAGRMPGHMHVLLAEAEVPYTQLSDMEDINGDFPDTDLVVVAGACDVVNPAASQLEGTPISGMPILEAHRARKILVFNLDSRPGYSGVPNLLYEQPNAILLWGDAKENLQALINRLTEPDVLSAHDGVN